MLPGVDSFKITALRKLEDILWKRQAADAGYHSVVRCVIDSSFTKHAVHFDSVTERSAELTFDVVTVW